MFDINIFRRINQIINLFKNMLESWAILIYMKIFYNPKIIYRKNTINSLK